MKLIARLVFLLLFLCSPVAWADGLQCLSFSCIGSGPSAATWIGGTLSGATLTGTTQLPGGNSITSSGWLAFNNGGLLALDGNGNVSLFSEGFNTGGGVAFYGPTGTHYATLAGGSLSFWNGASLNYGSGTVSLAGTSGGAVAITSGNILLTPGTGDATVAETSLMVGSATPATLATGELGLAKISASGTAPGAGSLKVEAVAGTNAGTCKIIAYAGTSTTPVTLVDNVGSGC